MKCRTISWRSDLYRMDVFYGILLVLASSFGDILVTAVENDGHFVNAWAAEIAGGLDAARDVAEQHGYKLVRSLDGIPDHYLLERSDTPHRARRSADHHTRKLSDDERVGFVEQQQQKTRVKRDVADREVVQEIVERDGLLDDPQYQDEWYIFQGDSIANRGDHARADLRVVDVWKKDITGEGVVVTIIDDGLETDHEDLKGNYEPNASYDFNDNDPDPSPRYEPTNENKHGTRCAGEVAMMANNKVCGVGIAYNAKIGGIRILDGIITDHIEASALSYNVDQIDIYSCSWGPSDNGNTCEGPGTLTRKALEYGVKKGRKGKGAIYVWAAGNGGRSGDNCNADGYTSAIETLTVSSASQYRNIPYYSERCASTLTTAYSSGTSAERKVISVDLHNKCTDSHSGTSAAAPMAAGILALLLEVNPNVTWRDVQHIVAATSRMEPLALEKGWYRNAAGFCVNLAFGFGLMDALAIVELANPKTWKNVGEQKICRTEPVKTSGFPKREDSYLYILEHFLDKVLYGFPGHSNKRDFLSGQSVEVEFVTDGCKGQENEINYMEHVQFVVDITHKKRGNIYVEAESPSGTITTLMLERNNDESRAGFKNWPLTSVHSWGENPRGTWKLRVADRSGDNLRGSLKSATLIIYGTKEQPEYQKHMTDRCGDLDKFANVHPESEVSHTMENLKKLFGSSSTSHGADTKQSLNSILHSLEGQKSGVKQPPATSNRISTSFQAMLQSISKG